MIAYRQFNPDDTEACRELILRCIPEMEGVSSGGHEALAARASHSPLGETLAAMHCIIAEDDSELVGMGALNSEAIKRMYVSPERRDEGIGQEIYRRLESEARCRGIHHLQLESSMNAVGFYDRMGFLREHEHSWTLGGATITNVIMSKDL